MNLIEFSDGDPFDEDLPDGQYDGSAISEGSRDVTMSRFAGRVIRECGDCDKAYQTLVEELTECTPLLETSELTTIWHSVQCFYVRLSQQDGYIAPEAYNDPSCHRSGDYSDIG